MGTILTPLDIFSEVGSPNPLESIRAGGVEGSAYAIAGLDSNGGVIYTSVTGFPRVRHLGGVSKILAVTVSVNDITVQLGTNAGGAVTSNANAVVAAVLGATTLVSATVQGTGAGIAGINENFMPLADDPFGSIRPGLQALTNRTTWLRNGVVKGTRTLAKVHIDAVGEVASLAAAGELLADNAVQVERTANQGLRAEPARIKWRNVGVTAADGNPPSTTPLINELRPTNIIKAEGYLSTDGAGNISVLSGSNIASVTISGTDRIVVTMASPMLTTAYCVVANVINVGTVPFITGCTPSSTTVFFIDARSNAGAAAGFATNQFLITFHVTGRQ